MTATYIRHQEALGRCLKHLAWAGLLAALWGGGTAHAQSEAADRPGADNRQERLDQAHECAESDIRLERLQCYDSLFREASAEGDSASSERSQLWQSVSRLEAERDSSHMGLMVEQTDDTVLMSVPALGTVPPRPVLVISCAANITRFQLHLPKPSDASRVALTLQNEHVRAAQNWRVLDGGYVLSGGRGLPAIDTLKRLLSGERLELTSEMSSIDGLSFDVAGLRDKVKPLREMCRW